MNARLRRGGQVRRKLIRAVAHRPLSSLPVHPRFPIHSFFPWAPSFGCAVTQVGERRSFLTYASGNFFNRCHASFDIYDFTIPPYTFPMSVCSFKQFVGYGIKRVYHIVRTRTNRSNKITELYVEGDELENSTHGPHVGLGITARFYCVLLYFIHPIPSTASDMYGCIYDASGRISTIILRL